MQQPPAIIPLSEQCALVQWPQLIDAGINRSVMALYHTIKQQPFTGFTEAVPAYASLAVYYNILEVKRQAPEAFVFVREQLQHHLQQLEGHTTEEATMDVMEIPVRYGGQYGPDIEEVATTNHITVAEVIQLHTATTYRVFMMGFMPGFAYMGITHPKLEVNRKAQPRPAVPAGSVGLAGRQTGIYPFTSPGGWQIIGQTELGLFNAEQANPCLLQAGQLIKFIAV